MTCGAKSVGTADQWVVTRSLALTKSPCMPSHSSLALSKPIPHLCLSAPSPEPQLSSNSQRPGRRSEMAMALASERMALASSTGYSHVSVTSAPSSSLSIARWSHCRTRTAGAAVTAAGLRLAGVSSAASFVCKSSVRPLSDANGNVSEFQSGMSQL